MKRYLILIIFLFIGLLNYASAEIKPPTIINKYEYMYFSQNVSITNNVSLKEDHLVIRSPEGKVEIIQPITKDNEYDFFVVQVYLKFDGVKLGERIHQAPTLILETKGGEYNKNPVWIRSEEDNWRVASIITSIPKKTEKLQITIRNSALSGSLFVKTVTVWGLNKNDISSFDYPVKWNHILNKKDSILIHVKSPPIESYNTMNKKLYGFNSRYYTKNLSVRELLNNMMVKSVQPILARFPGGTISNFYRSECDCLNPQDIKFFPEYEKSLWYKDLFVKLSEPGSIGSIDYALWSKENKIGTTIVLNPVLEKSGKEFIGFIETMKNNGTKVELLEMGNELYGEDQRGTILPKPIDYFKRIGSMVDELKASYPDIPIGAPFSTENWTWNTSFAQTGIKYDGIVLHMYAYTSSIASIEDDRHLLAYPYKFVPELLQRMRELVPNKKFWVTEWGIIDRPLFKRNNSQIGTMFSANMIISLMREKDVEAACFHSLFDPHFGLFRFLIDASNEKFLKAENISYQYEFWKTLRKLFVQYEKNARLLIFENNGKQLEGHEVEAQAFSKSDKFAIILVNNSSKTYALNNIKLQTFENITGFIHPDIGTSEYQEYLPPFSVVIIEGKRAAFNIEMMSVPPSPRSLETKN